LGIFGSIYRVRIKYNDHDLSQSITTPKSPSKQALAEIAEIKLIEQRRKKLIG
jgi:hypothetical protein